MADGRRQVLAGGSLSISPEAERQHGGTWWACCLSLAGGVQDDSLMVASGCRKRREKSQLSLVLDGNGAAFFLGGFVDVLSYLRIHGYQMLRETERKKEAAVQWVFIKDKITRP